MNESIELKVMQVTDQAMESLEDPAARDRVLDWLFSKHASRKSVHDAVQTNVRRIGKEKSRAKKKAKSKSSLTILKNVNLNPSGNKSFKEFAKEKEPETYHEKNVVAIYFLKNILSLNGLNPNHVFTCYKDTGWPIPADLYTKLAATASEKGWLDTSNMADIQLTPHGENFVDHDLVDRKKAA